MSANLERPVVALLGVAAVVAVIVILLVARAFMAGGSSNALTLISLVAGALAALGVAVLPVWGFLSGRQNT